MKRIVLPLLAVSMVLAGCSKPSPQPSGAATPSLAPMVSESEALAPPVAPGATEAAPVAASAAAVAFPVGMRGRWGVNKADCDPSHGAAKGGLTIEEKSVKFYEAKAQPVTAKTVSPTELRAVFDYEGEGMAWQREARYQLEDGGKTLVLTEYGDDAPQGPRRHSRCK